MKKYLILFTLFFISNFAFSKEFNLPFNFFIEPHINITYGELGEFLYAKNNKGKDVVISRDAMLLTHDYSIETALHSIDNGTLERTTHINGSITIGDNSFIGAKQLKKWQEYLLKILCLVISLISTFSSCFVYIFKRDISKKSTKFSFKKVKMDSRSFSFKNDFQRTIFSSKRLP